MSLLVVAILLNFSWGNDHKPDLHAALAALGRPRRRTRYRTSDAPPSTAPQADERTARPQTPDDPRSGAARAADPGGSGPVADGDLDQDASRRFVEVALGGGFGDHYRCAAELGVALAAEHGFGDDPQRVAEAVVVFVDPSRR